MAGVEAVNYTREFRPVFQVGVTLLADRFTSESMSLGRSVVFDIAAEGGRMSTRSIDGRIPRTNVTDTQITATLTEWVKKFEVTSFERFTSQSDERMKMHDRITKSVNREIDYMILAELANASTSYSATAAPATLEAMTRVKATLSANGVAVNPNDVTMIISPFLAAKLENINGYVSADYVNTRPLAGGDTATFSNQRKVKSWLEMGWIVHPNLPDTGTASCTCYCVHRDALGLAIPSEQIKMTAGEDDQDHFTYASATMKGAAKILQNPGILKFLHNDLA
jgi:hypothetical protein